jgi:2-iminobutanoate/2-iminopropanoate deaminase
MPRDTVTSPDAPVAIGPYSQGVRAGELLYLSGQTPILPDSGLLVEGDSQDVGVPRIARPDPECD